MNAHKWNENVMKGLLERIVQAYERERERKPLVYEVLGHLRRVQLTLIRKEGPTKSDDLLCASISREIARLRRLDQGEIYDHGAPEESNG